MSVLKPRARAVVKMWIETEPRKLMAIALVWGSLAIYTRDIGYAVCIYF